MQVLVQLVALSGSSSALPLLSPNPKVTLHWMGDEDDPQVFLEMFKVTAEACCWIPME